MSKFKFSMMSIYMMLTLAALPAKGGAPDRDFDAIVNFMADGGMGLVSYIANTDLHTFHSGKCGLSAGSNIPRKNDRGIQVAVFGCLFDAASMEISGFPLRISDGSTRTIVEMDFGLGRNTNGDVVSIKMFLLDDVGNAYYIGNVPFAGPNITQGGGPLFLVTINDTVTAEASQGNGKGKGKKDKGETETLTADILMVDIFLCEVGTCSAPP